MSEKPKKNDPWQLIAVILIVGSLFVGIYITNLNIEARFNSLEITVSGNAAALDLLTQNITAKSGNQEAKQDAPADEAASLPDTDNGVESDADPATEGKRMGTRKKRMGTAK